MESRRKTELSTCSRHPRRKSSRGVQKSENPRRASARLQGRSPDARFSLGLPPKPFEGGKEQVGTRQRKRRRKNEEDPQLSSEKARSAKRARNSASVVYDNPQPLNAQNLDSHTVREGYVDMLELMDSEFSNIPGSRGSKWSASEVRTRNGSTASSGMGDLETISQVTQKSSYTAAHYRLSILPGANIVFRFSPAPEDVYTRIAAIIQRPVSEERKKELLRIAQTLHNQFAPVLSGAAREDDCIGLFHQALSALGHSDSILLARKAGMMH